MSEPTGWATDAAKRIYMGQDRREVAALIQSAIDQALAEKDRELARVVKQNEELAELAAIGAQWRDNSSLEKWFPITALKMVEKRNEIERLKAESSQMAALLDRCCPYEREKLSLPHHSTEHVANVLDLEADKLTKP
jgi:hypothetical protein